MHRSQSMLLGPSCIALPFLTHAHSQAATKSDGRVIRCCRRRACHVCVKLVVHMYLVDSILPPSTTTSSSGREHGHSGRAGRLSVTDSGGKGRERRNTSTSTGLRQDTSSRTFRRKRESQIPVFATSGGLFVKHLLIRGWARVCCLREDPVAPIVGRRLVGSDELILAYILRQADLADLWVTRCFLAQVLARGEEAASRFPGPLTATLGHRARPSRVK